MQEFLKNTLLDVESMQLGYCVKKLYEVKYKLFS